jgi:hypothetical protein
VPEIPAPFARSVEVAPGGITGNAVVARIVGREMVFIVNIFDDSDTPMSMVCRLKKVVAFMVALGTNEELIAPPILDQSTPSRDDCH